MKKRFLSLLLALSLTAGLAAPVLAADAAATIRLSKTTGTVSVSKSSGKSVTLLSNMRLYNGYHVATSAKSYAWMNLDDAKLVKEDASSEVEVRKNGKKLEVNLISGKAFFDVTEKLDDDESLNISTSTMIAGIRGTAGYVEVLDRWTTGLTVLEGVVQCSVADPVTGQVKTEDVRSGETVWGVVYPQEQAGDKCDIVRKEWTVEGTPGFVLWDVVRDMDLCDRIQADTGVDIPLELAKEAGGDPSGREPDRQTATPEVLDEIKQRLERDETDLQQRQEQVDTALREQDAGGSPDKVFVQDPASNSGGGSSGGGSSGSGVVRLTMPVTDMMVQQELDKPSTRQVVVSPGTTGSSTLDIGINMRVDAGKTLTLESGVPARVQGSLTVDGTADLKDSLVNQAGGAVTVNSSNTLRVGGNFTSQGAFTVTATGRAIVDGSWEVSAMTLTPGAQVLSKNGFGSTPIPGDWRTSDTPDSNGYYRLYISYTVTFDANGGTLKSVGGTTVDLHVYADGLLMTDLPEVSHPDGYNFVGWYTEKVGGSQVDNTTVFTQNTTVYARWSVGGEGWSYDAATDTLTFTGEKIEDYINNNTRPWLSHISTVKNVVIEDGITSIGDHALYNCPNLTSVTIPSSVSIIGNQAFHDCPNLANVVIPSGVQTIGASAFYNCGMTSVEIPDGVTVINSGTFSNCAKLTSVTIPSSVDHIKSGAFSMCKSLTSVKVPATNVIIEESAFNGCSGLISAEIPGVTKINKWVFRNCTSLTSVTIPSGVTAIGEGAFEGCTDLAAVTLPSTVTSIVDSAFKGCTSLAGVTIPSGTKTIGNSAFEGCASLTDITVPSTVWKIGTETFAGCTGLQSAAMNCGITTLPTGIFRNCTSLKNVTFPSSLEIIDTETFAECTGLTEIDLPEGLTTINGDSFWGCTSLAKVKLPSTVTTVARTAFNKDQNIEFTYAGDDTAWTSLMKDSEGTIGGSGWTVHCTDGDGTYTETGWTFNATP